jgi:arylsulfatase A-like enzyme
LRPGRANDKSADVLTSARPLFLSLSLSLLFAVEALAQAPSAQISPPASTGRVQPESLLLITMDTTRPDHLQPYGATNVETPGLQALADSGVVFDHAYSVAPITLPAHTSIHTGLYPPQTGVRNNGIHYVPAEVTTLAERLRAAGFHTGAFVSASVLDHRYGLNQGFEVYDDDLSSGRERHPRMVPDRPAESTVTAASAWLDKLADGDRYFLWVHLYDPHATYSPPSPYRDRYQDHLYDGEIAYMDSQIARLLAHPRIAAGRGVAVIVLADHGESLGEHGEQTHGILAYDSTLHVPLIMRLPGSKAGTRVAQNVSQVDLVPTVIDLFHLSGDPGLPGRSLLPLVQGAGPAQSAYAETYLPFYTYGWAKLRVLRQERWKYIDGPAPELYDIMRDPRELSNQLKEQPGIAHDMQRDFQTLLSSMSSPEREEKLPIDTAAAAVAANRRGPSRRRHLGFCRLARQRRRFGQHSRDRGHHRYRRDS